MYIVLSDRSDRLGSNIISYISQITVAMVREYYIDVPMHLNGQYNLRFADSIFVKVLLSFIQKHNARLEEAGLARGEHVGVEGQNLLNLTKLLATATLTAKKSLYQFFREQIWPEVRDEYYAAAADCGYTAAATATSIAEGVVVAHVRLDDITNYLFYPSDVCTAYYTERINNDEPCEETYFGGRYNCQTIVPEDVLNAQIQRALGASAPVPAEGGVESESDKVILVTSPGSCVGLPYTCLANPDESLDLFLLCEARIYVGSKSTFGMMPLFFGRDKEAAYLPRWGHAACAGFCTKYDTAGIVEFYY